MTTTATQPKYRAFEFGVTRASVKKAGDVPYLRAENELESYGTRLTDRLMHWAKTAPNRT